MHFDKLSNAQLYALWQNPAQLKIIRNGAHAELLKRGLPEKGLHELMVGEVLNIKSSKPLPSWVKITLLVFPFFSLIHVIVSSVVLDGGYKLRWKQYWRFVFWGYVMWTVVLFAVIIIAGEKIIA